MNQKIFLTNLLDENQDATIIGSLGTISYDLTDIPHPDKILIRGAMGAAMGAGLGYALAKPERKVIVLIGDGAFLMKNGTVATIMAYKPKNLMVYVLNNGMHKSTGGQETNFEYLGMNPKFPCFEVINIDEIHDNERPSTTESNTRTSGTTEEADRTVAKYNRN